MEVKYVKFLCDFRDLFRVFTTCVPTSSRCTKLKYLRLVSIDEAMEPRFQVPADTLANIPSVVTFDPALSS